MPNMQLADIFSLVVMKMLNRIKSHNIINLIKCCLYNNKYSEKYVPYIEIRLKLFKHFGTLE